MELGLMTGRKPQLHRIVEGRSVDFVFPEVLLCVELDSWRHHGSRDAFLRDRARDRALSAAGWQVLRYTWREIEANPRRYVDELACVYAQREIVARALAARLITL